jgi:hypothetical protein
VDTPSPLRVLRAAAMTDQLKQALKDAEAKRIIKEAIREWLDEQFTKFGRWSFYGILAAATTLILYMTLIVNGWHKP